MVGQQGLSGSASPSKNNRKLLALIVPLLSCGLSSFVGIFIGQVGNLIYRLLGDSAACLSLPGFLGLFVLTFALSFFSNRLLKRVFTRVGKRGEQ